MIRRFLAFLRRTKSVSAPTRPVLDLAPLCRVQTDLTDRVRLHAGDSLSIERAWQGYRVEAFVLRERKLQTWVLFHAATLREAYDLLECIEWALKEGAVSCNPRARVQRLRARRLQQEQQEVAF